FRNHVAVFVTQPDMILGRIAPERILLSADRDVLGTSPAHLFHEVRKAAFIALLPCELIFANIVSCRTALFLDLKSQLLKLKHGLGIVATGALQEVLLKGALVARQQRGRALVKALRLQPLDCLIAASG